MEPFWNGPRWMDDSVTSPAKRPSRKMPKPKPRPELALALAHGAPGREAGRRPRRAAVPRSTAAPTAPTSHGTGCGPRATPRSRRRPASRAGRGGRRGRASGPGLPRMPTGSQHHHLYHRITGPPDHRITGSPDHRSPRRRLGSRPRPGHGRSSGCAEPEGFAQPESEPRGRARPIRVQSRPDASDLRSYEWQPEKAHSFTLHGAPLRLPATRPSGPSRGGVDLAVLGGHPIP